jgi:hypothetical protein
VTLQPGACTVCRREGTSAGSQVHGEVAAGLQGAGVAMVVFGIGLVPGGFLFDESETRNAVERIRLHLQPGLGDLLRAAGTDAIRMRMDRRECLLNPSKLFECENIDGQGDIKLMLNRGLVGWIGEEFRFCHEYMGDHGFACDHRSKSVEFSLTVREVCAGPQVDVQVLRQRYFPGTVWGTRVWHWRDLPMAILLRCTRHGAISNRSNLCNAIWFLREVRREVLVILEVHAARRVFLWIAISEGRS